MMRFYKKDKNKSRLDTLANALSKRDNTVINTGNVGLGGTGSTQQDTSWGEGANQLLSGAGNLYNGLKSSGLFNNGGTTGLTNGNYFGAGSSGSMTFDNIMGNAGSGSMTFDSLGSGSSGFGGGMPWGAIAGAGKTGYNAFSGKDGSNYSDTEEAIIYPLQGASIGAQTGNPWVTLGTTLYGLGYSFKDDLGLKDNNFLTDIIYPIGMGDKHRGFIQL